MKLRPDQLPQKLAGGIPPVVFIFGDEPLLVLEAADAVRDAARQLEFTDRQVFHAEKGFDYGDLRGAGQSLSLFASRRLLDLRLPSGKPGKEGGAVISEIAGVADPDTVLLITSGKLDRSTLNTAWVKAIDKAGLLVQCWPMRPNELPDWLDKRMRKAGLLPEPRVASLLAARVEGNLLAAKQEIEKLALIHGPGPISVETIESQVADSSRFQVFLLLDTMLAGALPRCLKILSVLRGEDTAPAIIASLITREIRATAQLKQAMETGANVQGVYRSMGIWDSRKMGFERAMRRLTSDALRDLLLACGILDKAIKGMAPDDPWCLIEKIVARTCTGR